MIQKRFFIGILATALAGTTLPGCAAANGTAGQQAPPSMDGKQAVPSPSGRQVKTQGRPKTQVKTMAIRLKLPNTTLTATLDDNATARDFASLLPLPLTLTDYGGYEKISDLPKKLSTQGAPEGMDPAAGDIILYAPGGNLALFLKDGSYYSGLVKLGKFDSGFEALKQRGPLKVTIERIEK